MSGYPIYAPLPEGTWTAYGPNGEEVVVVSEDGGARITWGDVPIDFDYEAGLYDGETLDILTSLEQPGHQAPWRAAVRVGQQATIYTLVFN
jgi:hypothetical protein